METEFVFDEIKDILEAIALEEYMEQMKSFQEILIDREQIRAEKEEQRNRIAHWKSQTNLHPLPKHSHFQKPTWLRTRSNPKLR